MKSSPETPVTYTRAQVEKFKEDPEKSGKELAEHGRRLGYQAIITTTNHLWEVCTAQNQREVIAFLRQPEWKWRRLQEDPAVVVAGIQEPKGFVPVGYYVTGPEETGKFCTLDLVGEGASLEYVPGDVPDPRPKVRPRLFVKQRKYYLAFTGKVTELARAGYKKAQIVLTKGKGYFKNHEAYVLEEGPFTASEAKRVKIEKVLRPINHR